MNKIKVFLICFLGLLYSLSGHSCEIQGERPRKISQLQFHPFETLLDYKFSDPELLQKASAPRSQGFERLEFLGDRVLGLGIACLLYYCYPSAKVESLAQLFGYLTSKKVLAEVYINLEVPPTLISSEFYKAPLAGPIAEKTASDIIEALLGAVYKDKGMGPSQECVKKLFSPYIEHGPKAKAISAFSLPQQKLSFPDLDILQRRISYHFKNVMLLQAAFIHPSAHGRNFEKLAFLGTRVLALGVAENAIDSNPIASEGLLTEKFIEKVNTPQFQQAFARWQLGYFLIRNEGGFGNLLPSPHTAPRMAAQTIQALLGAIYLDGDWIAAREMVQKLLFSDPPLTLELSSKEKLRSRLRGALKEQKGSAPQVHNSFPLENSPTLAIEEWPALGKSKGTNPEDIRWPRNLIHRSSPQLHEKISLSVDEEWPALTKKGC
ncbi:MAG: hypothetical protein K0M45_10660 [Candidatus Paracaedibacteraceae bacterium]|nr:hypothetical protein [Candidatus Paracaedibacteraceae bacterium]